MNVDKDMCGLESTIEYLKLVVHRNRRNLFWLLFFLFVLFVMISAKEVTVLLFLSYGIAILIDPLVTALERKKISRETSVICFGLVLITALVSISFFAIPILLEQYAHFMDNLPQYIQLSVTTINSFLQKHFRYTLPLSPDELWASVRGYTSTESIEPLKKILSLMGETLLSGYSFTLTALNLFLLPFFVYYFTCDLRRIHSVCLSFLPVGIRKDVQTVGRDILSHVYAFFEGQVIVSLILVLFYDFGLLLVGLPSALLVGTVAGLLNMVPYLGVLTGVTMATIITLVANPGWYPMLKVWAVFVCVQSLEGTVLTPKIVGDKVGIHPLAAMVALIIGGKLFGLAGLLLAIPSAAALRVLFKYILDNLNKAEAEDSPIIAV